MNNFRQYPPKPYGGRGPDLPNPWMNEEELAIIRRQNPQFHPGMPNINPNMHSTLLNQTGVHPMSNKNLMGQNSCKMLGTGFTNTPNPNIFRSPYPMEEPNYSNRFMGDRFNSYSPMNVHSKLNEGPVFKDFPASNMMSPLSHKSDRFPSVSKQPLFSNVRQPQERLQCMQNDQSQFTSKYGNQNMSSQVFQGKDFPFSNLKDPPSQNSMPYNNKLPASTGCNVPPFKSNVRTPNLFPAYTPKDSCETTQKSLTLTEGNVTNASHSPYNSDFIGKSTFCDNTSIAPSYSKSMESFQEKESYQEKNIPVESFSQANKSQFITDNTSTFKTMSSSPLPQDSYKALPNTEMSQDSYKNVQNSQVLHDSYKTMPSSHMPQNSYKNASNFPLSHDSYKPLPSSQMSHDSFKAVPNSQVSHETYKGLDGKVPSSNSKYPFSSENQQACFQSSNDIPFQSSDNVSFSFPSNTSTTDCLLQTTPFSSQSDVHQTSKETFSTFSFESNMNTTDIADLLPGLDAFLKETVNKSEQSVNKPEDASKSDFAKSTVPNCALSDDEWSKHSIPLIGDSQFSSNSGNNQNESVQQPVCDQVAAKEKCDKFESVFEKPGDLKSTAVDQPNSNNQDKQSQLKSVTGDTEASKARSALEEAIDLLVTTDPIVGLDYITEYKKNISQQGSFPFRCKLCNSAITRPSIIDHIIGSKHRVRYLKTKDESKYEYILSLKLDKNEKDLKIAEVAFQLEAVYGRGRVIVNTDDTPKAFGMGSTTWKESNDGVEEPVFTLDKIPIGFEALSPQHDDIDPSDFTLDSDLSQVKQDNTFNITEKEISNKPLSNNEVKNEASKFDPAIDFCCEPSSTTKNVVNSTDLDSVVKNEVSQNSEGDAKKVELSSNSSQVKRALSPDPSCRAKLLKSETSDDFKQGSETVTTEECSEIKAEESSSETKDLILDLLETLGQSEISTEEEASTVLKVINMLMQMLLRYKLQHLSLSKVENLMKSLQIKSPENIEELKSLLKNNTILEKSEDKELPEIKKTHQVKEEENIELCLSHFENIDPNTSQSMNTVNNSGTNPASCAQMTQSLVGISNTPVTTQTSSMYSCSMSQTSSNMTSSVPQMANPQTANSGGLKPPPFFGWPQGSESMTNKVSYAPTQGNQSMMWTNAYQHSQPQFNQMSYYQPQNYGNTFGGPHAYQTQFSVMPQASVQMSQPPLPPPPPIPPPPPPANPPLPPSGPFLHNQPSLPPYPKNQPLPPLP